MYQRKIPDDYVAIAEHICPVCGCKHTHNTEILLHKQLRSIPKDKRVTGWGMCEEHQKLFDRGYIALVGADLDKSKLKDNGNVSLEGVYRTGKLAHLRKHVFKDLFDNDTPEHGVIFVDDQIIEDLAKIQEQADENV